MNEKEIGQCLGCGIDLHPGEMDDNQHGCFDEIDGYGKTTLCSKCHWCANCDETHPEDVPQVKNFLRGKVRYETIHTFTDYSLAKQFRLVNPGSRFVSPEHGVYEVVITRKED